MLRSRLRIGLSVVLLAALSYLALRPLLLELAQLNKLFGQLLFGDGDFCPFAVQLLHVSIDTQRAILKHIGQRHSFGDIGAARHQLGGFGIRHKP